MAGMDGIKNKILPGEPREDNIFKKEAKDEIKTIPGSLTAAVNGLKRDKEFLLNGGVFSEDFISKWTEMKEREITEVEVRPHPYEFFMYHNY